MKKVIVLIVVLLSFIVGGTIYVNVTREIPVMCTINRRVPDKDEVELYADGEYMKKYISYLDFYGNNLENLERERDYSNNYVKPRDDELEKIYANFGLVYHVNAGDITWIEKRRESNFTIYFDEDIDVELISESLILKGIKIDGNKVKLDYFVGELEKQGYTCE